MKTIDTLIEDVVDLAEKGVDLQHHKSSIDRFSNNMRELIEEFLSTKEKGKRDFRLRMSALGTPARKLWYQKNNISDLDKFSGGHLIKFFYGHIIEELVLLLAEVSGHKVEHRQRELQLYDVIGHQDAEIDGVLVDVKSTSAYSFDKFRQHKLYEDDPFGYITQISAYSQASKNKDAAFWAVNKQTADMTLMHVSKDKLENAVSRISYLKKILDSDVPPQRCYDEQYEGKTGNKKIDKNCTFCPYKYECWKDVNNGEGLRVFKYARGRVYLTHIETMPKVEEVL